MNPQDFLRSRSGRVIRTRGGYWAFVPAPLPPEIRWSHRLLSSLSAAAHSVGSLAALAQAPPPTGLPVRLLLLREAQLSHEVGHKGVSLLDLYLQDCSPGLRQATAEEVQRVLKYTDALEEVPHAWEGRRVSLDDLCRLQGRLAGTRASHLAEPASFRETQNWLGPPGSTVETAAYVPPPADAMVPALRQLVGFLENSIDLPPLLRLALFHYQLEAIHPFETGNGRLGRFLNSAFLTAWRVLPQPLLHLSGFLQTNRQRYFERLLRVSQRSAWEDWLDFFFEGVALGAEDTVDRIHKLERLRKSYLARIRNARNAARLRQAIDYLYERPVFTVRGLEAAIGVNFAGAQRYVYQLAAEGLIVEITGQARNRVYKAADILAILEEPRHPTQ